MTNAEIIWQDFLSLVEQEVGSRVIETWFKVLRFTGWDTESKTVFLDAPNRFVTDWVSKHYTDLFKVHFGRLLHMETPHVVIRQMTTEQVTNTSSLTVLPARSAGKSVMVKSSPAISNNLNNAYKFETFVVGPNNSLAFAAAHAVTTKPGILYNPLFIYGGSGLGKTHLLHAIAHEIRNAHPEISVLYQTADRFVQEFIEAIRFDRIRKFQAKYQAVDFLLIDDLQFISNKEQTQEAFFHIFNTLYESDKQIVFSSDTFPQHMYGIAERLRSRIAGGLITDIHVPSLETKIAILKRKAEQSKQEIDDAVFEYIASLNINNIRELEGALIRVIACASLNGEKIDLAFAQRVLSRIAPERTNVDSEKIITVLLRHYGITLQELRSKSRNKDIAQVRQLAMYLLKKCAGKSSRDIGTLLGGRDHSTVMHGLARITQVMETDSDFSARVRLLEHEILQR